MKNKTTKRALLASALSLLLCCAMLVGTTFAWFTDSVSSNGNKIVAGTLQLGLEKMNKDGTWTDITESTDPLFNYEKWEPGYTSVQVVKVVNKGNLALKWKATFRSNETLGILADAIDVYVNPGITAYPTRDDVTGWTNAGTLREFVDGIETTTYGRLDKKDDAATLGIALKMRESAGNIYQGESLGLFDIVILATQNTVEEDTFDETYDENADYDGEIGNADSLAAAIANGGYYELTENIVLDAALTAADASTVIDLNGFSISGAGIVNNGTLTLNATAAASAYSLRARAIGNAITVESGNAIKNNGTLILNGVTVYSAATYGLNNAGTVTVNGGEINAIYNTGSALIEDVTLANTISGRHGIYHRGTALTINGGTFSTTSGNELINAKGNVTINGGTFTQIAKSYLFGPANAGIVINGGEFNGFVNDNGTNDMMRPGAATVNGGTFNFNPTNWLADDESKAVDVGGEFIIVNGDWKAVDGVKGLLVNDTNARAKEYKVYTADAFVALNGLISKNTTAVTLMADIDMTGKTWTPVDMNVDADGKLALFDGNGYTISNLTINGQAMFTRFAGIGNVTVKDIAFDNANVKSASINTAIIVGHTYQNLLLDNVDVTNSSVTGGYKVATLVGTVYNENPNSSVTATIKNCDIDNCEVTTVSYDFMTCGVVGFLYEGDGEKLVFENSTISNTTLYNTNSGGYNYHAFVYYTDAETNDCFNEADGITVTNCKFIGA